MDLISRYGQYAGSLVRDQFLDGEISGNLLTYEPKGGTYAPVQTSLLLVLPESGSANEAEKIFALARLRELAEDNHLVVAFLLSENGYADGERLIDSFYRALDQKAVSLPCHNSLIYHIGFGVSADLLLTYGRAHPVRQAGLLAVEPKKGGVGMAKAPVPMMIYQGSAEINAMAEEMNQGCPWAKTVIAGIEAGSLRQIVSRAYYEVFRPVRRWRNGPTGTLMPRVDFEAEGFIAHVDDTSLGDNGGRPHTWYEYAPAGRLGDACPLVIALHGAWTDPLYHAEQTRWHEIAKREGFVVAFPKCSREDMLWNPGMDPELPDDEAYILALVEFLCREYPIDRSRIYLSGFSHGGMSTIAFGLANPEVFAAIAPNSGYLGVLFSDDPKMAPHKERYQLEGKIRRAMEKGLGMPVFCASGYAEGRWPIREEDTSWKTVELLLAYNGIAEEPYPSAPEERFPMRADKRAVWGADRRFDTLSWYSGGRVDGELGRVNATFARELPHAVDTRQIEMEYRFFKQYSRAENGSVVYQPGEIGLELAKVGRKRDSLGQERSYYVYSNLPKNHALVQTALIVVLRADDSLESARKLLYNGLKELADQTALIVAFPNPAPSGWNYRCDAGLQDDLKLLYDMQQDITRGTDTDGRGCHPTLLYYIGADREAASMVHAYATYNPTQIAGLLTFDGGFEQGWLKQAEPVCVPAWLVGASPDAKAYFQRVNGGTEFLEEDGLCVRRNPQNPAIVTVVDDGADGCTREYLHMVWRRFFSNTRRWNSEPAGVVTDRLHLKDFRVEAHEDDCSLGDNGALAHTWYEFLPSCMEQDSRTLRPLLLVLHGGGCDPLYVAEQTRWYEVGEEFGFITVFALASAGRAWNSGLETGKNSDVDYLLALIAHLKETLPIDPERIYMSGFSNGSGMTQSFAAIHPELLAAIAPFNSRYSQPEAVRTLSAQVKARYDYRMPVWYVYGTRDFEYPVKESHNQYRQYNFWKEFNGIPQRRMWSVPECDIGVKGERVDHSGKRPNYPEGRFTTHRFYAADTGENLYNYTIVQDLPHAVDQAMPRLAWAYLSQFRRKKDGVLLRDSGRRVEDKHEETN